MATDAQTAMLAFAVVGLGLGGYVWRLLSLRRRLVMASGSHRDATTPAHRREP